MKKIKIEFIIPPNLYLGDEKRNPPLGLMYLAAIAEREGHNVSIIDLRGELVETFDKFIGESDIYGITATTPDYQTARKIAKIIKLRKNHCWIVLGGIHATAIPNRIDNCFDKVVIGEGENSIIKIFNDFINKDNSTRFYSSEFIKNLDSLPFPARHLLPFNSVFSPNALFVNAGPTATIMTSRGCPYSCSFCASKKMWHKKTRFRSSDNVVKEIKYIINKYNIKNFRFFDDTITLEKKRFLELCKKIKPLKIRWRVETRVDNVTSEMLINMKDAGCEEVAYGVESLSQEVIDKMNKNIKISDIYKAIKMAKNVGLGVRLYFMIGLPGEKLGYTKRLIKFCEETNPDGVDLSTFVPFPGCDVYENPKKFGLKLNTNNFNNYVMALGLKAEETEKDFLFVHDVMTNKQLKKERMMVLEYIKSRKMVKNF